MPTINNVREFVINALRQYHLLQVEAENTAVTTLLSDYVSYTNANTYYVAKETGKGLSTEDFTTAYMTKLDGIAAGAEVNVNADWSASSGDAEILNKPDIASLFGYAYYDSTSKHISFSYSSTSSELMYIDCANFIINGMVNNVSIEDYDSTDSQTLGTSYLFIDFNTVSGDGHTDIKIPLQSIFNPSNYYTKSQVDSTFATSAYVTSSYEYLKNVIIDNEEVTATAILDLNTNKVDKITGKGLSTNDFTTAYMTKLDGIAANAQVNVLETISVNGGTPITADSNKNIDITIPSGTQLSLANNAKTADDGDFTYVINNLAVNDHAITASYVGVLKQHQDISGKEDSSNKKTSLSVAANISDNYYPSTSAVSSYIGSLAELTSSELASIFAPASGD